MGGMYEVAPQILGTSYLLAAPIHPNQVAYLPPVWREGK